MEFLKRLFKQPTVKALETVENELHTVGYEMERARRKGESLSADLRRRILKARKWAEASGMSSISVNFFLDQGANAARKGR
jgi:predicted SPOUT superfamily RNA methylase MTH1